MNSKIIIQRPVTNGITLQGFNDLTDVYDNTQSGDTVVVYGGTYALVADGLQLRDGVRWKFIGNPTISSDAVAGTFYDNNVAVTVHFSGDVVITNSNGLASRIILQHASSVINGFHWVYDVRISQAGTAAPTVLATYKNTLGGSVVWTRTATGTYRATLSEAFPTIKTKTTAQYVDGDETEAIKNLVPAQATLNYITILNYGTSVSTLEDVFNYANLRVEVSP